MRLFFLLVTMFFGLTLSGQTTYTVEVIAPDSIYIGEHQRALPSPESPRPYTSSNYKLIRSFGEIDLIIDQLRKAGREETEKAQKLIENATNLNKAADDIHAAKTKAISKT